MVNEAKILSSRILIVDDEAPNILLLKKTLANAGFVNVHAERNSKKFTKAFDQFKPDLLLLDLRMPEPDGFQIMKEILEYPQDRQIPIMVLTAESESHIRLRALNEGAIDFLSKPFDYSEVILRVKNILKFTCKTVESANNEKEKKQYMARKLSRKSHDVELDVLQGLCRANRVHFKENRDNFLRVSHFAYLIAKNIGLSAERCNQIKLASSTYDIGKIGVPRPIFDKPGPLTPVEWKAVRTHPVLGAELLSGLDTPLMRMAQSIALEHHENWDGTGYPEGLRGESIQLEARIVCICDAFDAMTSPRPYRPRLSAEEALAKIKESSGAMFDPQLVGAFEKEFPKISQINHEDCNDPEIDPQSESDYVFDDRIIPKLKKTVPLLLKSHENDKLLIVDDIQTMRSAYRMIARQLGFANENIVEAASGTQALKKLEGRNFDLVITDLYMPYMTGLELIQNVRANPEFVSLPIIVVSEEDRRDVILNIIQCGASQYLLKPFTGYQMEEKINQAMLRSQQGVC